MLRRRRSHASNPKQVKRAIDGLIAKGEVRFEGDQRWRRYWLA